MPNSSFADAYRSTNPDALCDDHYVLFLQSFEFDINGTDIVWKHLAQLNGWASATRKMLRLQGISADDLISCLQCSRCPDAGGFVKALIFIGCPD